MEHTEVKVLRCRQMPYTGEERLPERPIIHPFGKDFVDTRIVHGGLALRIVRDRQALPLHPGVEHPQDEVKDAMRAQFTLRSTLGHREVRQDILLAACRETFQESSGKVGNEPAPAQETWPCSNWHLPPKSLRLCGVSAFTTPIRMCNESWKCSI
jgi:hypothetical protein